MGKHLSPEKKTACLAMAVNGIARSKIMLTTGVKKTALDCLLRKFRKQSDVERKELKVPKRKEGSGRTGNLTLGRAKKIRKLLKDNPRMSAKNLLVEDEERYGNVTPRTVQHWCHTKLGLPSRVPTKKPRITPAARKKRLDFALKYWNWTIEDWSQCMFSDESWFEVLRDSGCRKVRRPVGSNRYASEFTRKTVKHPDKIMVWGCFSIKGRGGLYFLPKNKTMNGEIYLECLRSHLKPFMRSHGMTVFQQDGAPCHRVLPVKRMIQYEGWEILEWPGNSPDLNPIENAWAWMKMKLENELITNVTDLATKIKEFWCTRMQDDFYLTKLVTSMPQRIAKVIEAKGAMTEY